MKYNEFDIRMKEYENSNKIFLQKKSPVIIRIDGRAFHTFTSGLIKPFDDEFSNAMIMTTKYLLENIPNCVFAYTQSDEISLLLVDYNDIKTDAWFNNNQQKLVSLASSMSTLIFNQYWFKYLKEIEGLWYDRFKIISKKLNKATFDARAFNLPKEEIQNYFLWRQKDCTKNSISMVAQANFSHKELQRKSSSDMQDMLMLQKQINWNNFHTRYKRGVCVYKKQIIINETVIEKSSDYCAETVIRNKAVIDNEMPILTKDKEFIEKIIDNA